MGVSTWVCMLVGLGNANFIMSPKFTEKRQTHREAREVDDRCACGAEPGMRWEEEHGGRKQRRGAGEKSGGKAESPLGSVWPGTR